MKKLDFSDLFNWVTENYGIEWNECNDVFFGNSLTFGSYDEVCCGDGISYTDIYDIGKESWDLTKEEVMALSPSDRGYVLIDIYLKEKGIEEGIFLNN